MISFVLPVYNCFDKLISRLPGFIDSLEGMNIPYEIIIVDDGSKIKSDIQSYTNKNCMLLINKRNYGKGYSLKRGVKAASGDVIIFMDGDFPFHPEVINRACSEIQKPNIDVIIGDRTLPESSYTEAPAFRSVGSKIISFFVNGIIIKGYKDTQCGIKGFKKNAAKEIFSKVRINSFSIDIEVLFMALKRKYTIKKIPVKVEKQLSSNVRVIFHGIEMIIDILKIKFNNIFGYYK